MKSIRIPYPMSSALAATSCPSPVTFEKEMDLAGIRPIP